MKLLHVSYTLILPEAVTAAEAEEWQRYRLGLGAIMDGNPLLDCHEVDLIRPASLGMTLREIQGVWAA